MSIYATSAEGYRDTTKWLVGFVPVASLVGAGALIGPRLIDEVEGSGSASTWASHHAAALVGIACVVLGISAIVVFGARVLSAQPTNFDKLLREEGAQELRSAFSAGVGAPYFVTEPSFRDALANLQAKWSTNDPEDPVTDTELNRANGTTEALRSWALNRVLAARFNAFRWWFAAAIALVIGGSLLTVFTLGPAPVAISEAVPVHVALSATGGHDLLAATGCNAPMSTGFLAIGGTWEHPLLEMSGPGCRLGSTWQPNSSEAQIRPVDHGPVRLRGPSGPEEARP